jgi:hypothetical protein
VQSSPRSDKDASPGERKLDLHGKEERCKMSGFCGGRMVQSEAIFTVGHMGEEDDL